MSGEQPRQVALLPERPPVCRAEAVPLQELPPDAAIVGASPDPALVESVRQLGILQPVLLVRAADGSLMVAEGRRRIKAARLAGLATIPSWVAEGDAAHGAAYGLTTHGTRRDNPAAELEAIERLLAQGASEQTIARATGLRVQTIRQRLRLRELDQSLRQALRQGRVAVGVVEQAAKLPPSAQQRLSARLAEVGKLTATDVAAERRMRKDAAVSALPLTLLTAAVPTEMPTAVSMDAVETLTSWLEKALQPGEESPARDLAVLADGLLLVQLRDGAACTVQVRAGAPARAEVG